MAILRVVCLVVFILTPVGGSGGPSPVPHIRVPHIRISPNGRLSRKKSAVTALMASPLSRAENQMKF